MKNERLAIQFDLIGALVQLVRMPACHAGGHEFESRTHRLIICLLSHLFGALVQLVRMPACHAGGHGFESRTHRRSLLNSKLFLFYVDIINGGTFIQAIFNLPVIKKYS